MTFLMFIAPILAAIGVYCVIALVIRLLNWCRANDPQQYDGPLRGDQEGDP